MARRDKHLTARDVQTITRPGRYGDSRGLYLVVRPSGTKSWVYRYQDSGRRRDLGLGPVDRVSLAKARELADEARRQRGSGQDPVAARRKANQRVPTSRPGRTSSTPLNGCRR